MEKYNTKFIQACKDNDINLIKNIISQTPKNNHLDLSILYGNKDIIQLILNTHEEFYYDIENIFENYCKLNNINLDNFEYIIYVYIKKFNDYKILNNIKYLFNKDLNILDWYFNIFIKYNINYNNYINKEDIITIISTNNMNELIKLSNYISLEKINYEIILKDSCLYGNLDAVKFIYNLSNDINILTQKCLYYSCYKNLELVKWLIDTNNNLNLKLEDYKAFRMACYRGKYDIAIYLYEKTPEVIDYIRDKYEICEKIVLNSLYGSLELCKWLYSFNIYEINLESLYEILIDTDLDIYKLEWLYSIVPEFIDHYNFKNLFNHTWSYNLDVIKWLYNKKPNIDLLTNELIIESCNYNKKDIIEWIITIKPDLINNLNNFNIILKFIIKHNCRYCDIFIWLYELKYKDIFPSNIQKLIKLSIKESTIEIFRYLISKYSNIILNLDDFRNICLKNNIHLIKMILNEYSYIKDLINTEYITELFNELLNNNTSTIICKWIYNYFPNIIIDNLTIYNAFLSNNIKSIKWILSLNYTFDLTYNNNIILNELCKSNYIDYKIIKYLFRLNKNIDLKIDNNKLFKSILDHEDYNIAKWLLKKINIELDSSYDHNFINFCKDNNHKFVKLLNKLNPERYKYIIEKDFTLTAKIIRIIYERKDIKIDELCMICLTNKTDIITKCNHIYCNNCIEIWLNINESCPYCRTNIEELYKIS